MDEESNLGYYYPATVTEPAELSIKILSKRYCNSSSHVSTQFCVKIEKKKTILKIATPLPPPSHRPTINQNVFAEIQSNVEMQNFTYQVVAHGKIIYAGNVAVPDRTYHVIKFNATFAMVPRATLIAYRFKNGEILATRTEIKIDEDLNNFVKVKLSKTETQPGKSIAIDIITNPTSFVGLFGVDQSVLLLKENKGITKDEAMESMNEYDRQFQSASEGPWHVPYRHYVQNYFNQFRYSDVILFTNAKQDCKWKKTARVSITA